MWVCASRGRCSGSGRRNGLAAAHGSGVGVGFASSICSGGFELFEPQLQLIDLAEDPLALGALRVKLNLQQSRRDHIGACFGEPERERQPGAGGAANHNRRRACKREYAGDLHMHWQIIFLTND